MKRETTMPRSRVKQLVIQEMPEETLVYDLERHKAHCLNKSAAVVWRHCDGQTSLGAMTTILQEETGLAADEKIVWLALSELKKARLLENPDSIPAPLLNPGRREALKRIGLVGGAAALLPLVTSIVAPTAVDAITCIPRGGACTSSAQCCSQLCRGAGGMGGGMCA